MRVIINGVPFEVFAELDKMVKSNDELFGYVCLEYNGNNIEGTITIGEYKDYADEYFEVVKAFVNIYCK